MKIFRIFCFLLITWGVGCEALAQKVEEAVTYQSNLKIIALTKHSYVHVSYLQTEKWGKVGCNGLVFVRKGEAVLLDTPVDSTAAKKLLDWIEQSQHAKPKAVVVNHFHVDCLGSLAFFHRRGIPSYAQEACLVLAREDSVTVPQNGIARELDLQIGGKKVQSRYFGEAHTRDNWVTYIPSEKVLFGGCMIKSLKSGRGNLADANVGKWSQTVSQVKDAYPRVKKVVPGHGKPAGPELLGFTIDMFAGDAVPD